VAGREPVGDCRDTRFDFGHKQGYWVTGATEPEGEPDSLGWNDKHVEALKQRVEELLSLAHLHSSSVRIEVAAPGYSTAKLICEAASAERVESIVIAIKNNRDTIIEVVKESTCAIVVVK
jgi:hypothetical protein